MKTHWAHDLQVNKEKWEKRSGEPVVRSAVIGGRKMELLGGGGGQAMANYVYDPWGNP